MKSVLILRHAKSSWGDSGLSDHDRPLNDRGKRDAPRIGELIQSLDIQPDQILSSTAKRARKTAKRVAQAMGYSGPIELLERLYLAPPRTYLDTISHLQDSIQRPLLVGHNPGIEEWLAQLIGHYEEMPTGALAWVELDIHSWQEVSSEQRASLKGIWRPREYAP